MRIPERDLPLFPLNIVLFPRMPLPLHVFEPRYREMVANCLRDEIGFGVVLIKAGDEVGGPAEPHSVGTVARIVDVRKLPDGRMNLITMGVVRFRIIQTHSEHAYMSGDVERWEDEMGDLKALPRVTRVAHQLFVEYMADLLELANSEIGSKQLVAPLDPQVLSYTIASSLQISNEEKQALLEMDTVEARLRQQITFLEREREILRRVKALREFLPKNEKETFSKN
jgi:Lon protease-like protein